MVLKAGEGRTCCVAGITSSTTRALTGAGTGVKLTVGEIVRIAGLTFDGAVCAGSVGTHSMIVGIGAGSRCMRSITINKSPATDAWSSVENTNGREAKTDIVRVI